MATETLKSDRLYHLCFDSNEFNDEEFSAAAFLVEKRRYVSIDTLIKDLTTFRECLQDEVVQLVNTDVYDTFLSVTNKLYQREGQLAKLRAPLGDMATRVSTACTRLEGIKDKVSEKLVRINELERKKQFTVQLLKLTVTEHKIRKLLRRFHQEEGGAAAEERGDGDAAENGASDTTDHAARRHLLATIAQHAKQLEVDERLWVPCGEDQQTQKISVTHRLAQLRSHVHDMLKDEYVAALKRYIAACGASPSANGDAATTEGDSSSSPSPTASASPQSVDDVKETLQVCFEAYEELEREDDAVRLFRETICTPAAEETISWSAARSSRDSPEALSKLFGKPIDDCLTHYKGVIDIGHAAGIERLVVAVWQSFSDTISKRLHFLFDSGNPYLFNHRYRAAHGLLTTLEGCCPTAQALHDLRQDMKLWVSRWNLDVYYKMREITVKTYLEKTLAPGLANAATLAAAVPADKAAPDAIKSVAGDFTYAPCAAAYSTLLWIVSDTVMLPPIGNKFLVLALNVIASLKQWHANLFTQLNLAQLGPGGEIAKGEAKAAPSNIVEGLPDTEVLYLLHADLSMLKSRIRTAFCPAFRQHFAAYPGAFMDAVEVCFDGIMMAASQVAHDVSCTLTSAVALQCIAQLNFVSTIPSHYRRTKKPVPTRPTPLTRAILDHLDAFRTLLKQKGCPPEIVESWSLEIVTMVTSKYKSICRDTRIKAQKQDASLAAFKTKEQQAAAASEPSPSAAMKDIDKMILQLYLDVDAYGQLLQSAYRVRLESFAPYQRLFEVVKRGAWLKGDPSVPDEPVDDLL